MKEIEVGTGRRLHEGTDVAVLSIGPVGNNVSQAIEQLESEGAKVSVAHYDMRFVKPLDQRLLEEIADKFDRIVTIEDGSVIGGFGSAVAEWMADHDKKPILRRIGLPDAFVEHGKVSELQQLTGLDVENIKKTILNL